MKAAFCILMAGFLLAGCNTVAGVGEDITGASRWFQQGLPRSY